MEQTPPTDSQVENAKRLRRKLLMSLYRFFTESPYAEIELGQLAEICGAEASDLNWNMVYLEKCGLIELGHSTDCPPFISCTASITAAGVDLVETPGSLNEKF
jgi:hypothetical protein